MSETGGRLRTPPLRILDSFNITKDPVAWLDAVIRDNGPYDFTHSHHDRSIVSGFRGALIANGTKDLKERVSSTAGQILTDWLGKHNLDGKLINSDREYLTALLSIFECVPAETNTSPKLYALLKYEDFRIPTPEARRLRQIVIFALAASNPPNMSREELENFFAEEMKDIGFALASLAGLCRLSPDIGIKHLRNLFKVVRDDDACWRLVVSTFSRLGDDVYQKLLDEINRWDKDEKGQAMAEIGRRAKL